MSEELKRMTLAERLWEEGVRDNFTIDDEGAMVLRDRLKRGVFFSRAIDMLEGGMTYHRMVLNGLYRQDSNVQVSIRTSESSYLVYGDRIVEADDFLGDPEIGMEEKLELFNGKESAKGFRLSDMLLHRLKGRYLWICLTALDTGAGSVQFKSIRIEFPRKSFIEYLPEVYQEDGEFLMRYLSIFQSVYLDMERNIDRLPMLLDAEAASGRFLDYLASWLGVYNEGGILSTEKFRYVVRNGVELNRSKGSVKSIVETVKLYAEEEPYIVEYFKLREYVKGNSERERLYNHIYTDNPHAFCIILKEGKVFERGGNIEELSKLIEKVRPAHTIAKIVVLKQSIRLDMHTYLGINTRLEKRSAAVMDDSARMDGSFYLDA